MAASLLVDRQKLIAFLEAEQKSELEEFKKDMVKFRGEEKAYKGKLVKAIQEALKKVQGGYIPDNIYSSYKTDPIAVLPGIPIPPTKPNRSGRACQLERQLTTLKLSTEPKIRINEKSEYMQFVCKLGE